MISHALQYASAGYRVFPLHHAVDGRCSCGNRECGAVGKHPRTENGVKDASASQDIVKKYWEKWPDANIGIAMGDNLIAIDLDGQAGIESMIILEENYGELPVTAKSKTPGGGYHLFFKVRNSLSIKNRVRIFDGFDIRSDGGYIVAPPSMHRNGSQYEWVHAQEPALAPDWLIGVLTSSPAKKPTTSTSEVVKKGQRNQFLTAQAGRYRRAGHDENAILKHLQIDNSEYCESPLAEKELATIAHSIGKKTADEKLFNPQLSSSYELSPWALAEIQPTKWVVNGYVPEGTCLVLGAEMKSGKTWFMLDLAIAVASQKRFLSQETSIGKTLIFSPEGSLNKTKSRLQRLCWGRNIDPILVESSIAIISERRIDLTNQNHLSRMRQTIEEYAPNLILLDPLISLHNGLDENSSEIKTLLDEIRSLQLNDKTTIIVSHHLNKAHKDHSPFHQLRGHSSIGAWADGLIILARVDDSQNPARTVQAIHRDAENPEPRTFTLENSPLTDWQKIQFRVRQNLDGIMLMQLSKEKENK